MSGFPVSDYPMLDFPTPSFPIPVPPRPAALAGAGAVQARSLPEVKYIGRRLLSAFGQKEKPQTFSKSAA